MRSIVRFRGEHAFLSNFYRAPVMFDGRTWPTSEHAYQAMKTVDREAQERIRSANTPGEAKRMGRALVPREGWDACYKFEYMAVIVRAKFEQHPELMAKLRATGTAVLVEGNDWGDRIWGMTLDKNGLWLGRNALGLLLMKIRREDALVMRGESP